MIRHVFKLIWNRKRTSLLMMAEIFVSFLVLFAVVALAVYMMDNWRRPIGFSIERVWNIDVDMKQTSDGSQRCAAHGAARSRSGAHLIQGFDQPQSSGRRGRPAFAG
jgi:hypothetical protein